LGVFSGENVKSEATKDVGLWEKDLNRLGNEMSPWAGQDEVAAGHLQWLVNALS